MTGAPLPRPLRWLLAAGGLAALGLLWLFDPLPIVDLPEHAAQVALLFRLGDPAFPFAAQYELNLFTPYLLAYLLAAFFALLLPVGLAFKAALSAIALLWVGALLRFQRRVGADPWWSLLALPLFFGLSFFWGFFNYLLAVPLVLLLVETAYGHGLAPTGRSGLRLALWGTATFFAHGMACVFGLAIAGSLIVLLAPGWRKALRALLPLLVPAGVVVAWTLLGDATVGGKLAFIPWLRRLALHRRLLGDWNDLTAAGVAGALLLVAAAALAAERRVLAGRPARERWARRLPLLATLAYLALAPEYVRPLAYAGSRFMVFVPLFAGWWLGPSLAPLLRALLPAVAAGWLLLLGDRFRAESRRLAELRPILGALPPHGKVLMVRYGFGRSRFELPLALHQPAWYTVEQGGQVDFSFAAFRTELVRYREDRRPAIPEDLSHLPWQFDLPAIAGGYYDFWLVYRPADADPARVLPGENGLRLRLRQGDWWLYETGQAP